MDKKLLKKYIKKYGGKKGIEKYWDEQSKKPRKMSDPSDPGDFSDSGMQKRYGGTGDPEPLKNGQKTAQEKYNERMDRVAMGQRKAVNEASPDTDWSDAGQRKRWGGDEPYTPIPAEKIERLKKKIDASKLKHKKLIKKIDAD